MKVLTSPPSPFGRKVRLMAIMKGLEEQVEVVDPASSQNRNPLSKIPVLETDDGMTLFDSRVICEYLDAQHVAPVMFPGEGAKRWQMLTRAALADGIMDAALLIVYEGRMRPEDKHVQSWIDMQQKKIDEGLAHLEKAPPEIGAHPDYGHLTLACALGYLDFRHAGKWRANHPKMVAWLDGFAERVPGFAKTAPPAA